jgi:hypothetical protein
MTRRFTSQPLAFFFSHLFCAVAPAQAATVSPTNLSCGAHVPSANSAAKAVALTSGSARRLAWR